MQMELDERKEKILKAIIQTYLETGEPVGSRTISKYSDLQLSSATIRNEMSDLEELGYIIQPHTDVYKRQVSGEAGTGALLSPAGPCDAAFTPAVSFLLYWGEP